MQGLRDTVRIKKNCLSRFSKFNWTDLKVYNHTKIDRQTSYYFSTKGNNCDRLQLLGLIYSLSSPLSSNKKVENKRR